MTSTESPTSTPPTSGQSSGSGSTKNAPTGSRGTRENAADKARRLLVEGRVRVTFVSEKSWLIRAEVRGDSGQVYVVDHGMSQEARWTCDCPARTDCSHLKAVWLVTAVQR